MVNQPAFLTNKLHGLLQDYNEQCYEYSGSSSNPLDRGVFFGEKKGTWREDGIPW